MRPFFLTMLKYFLIPKIMLEANIELFQLLHNYSELPLIWIIADFPIFFLPIFLWGLWLYYTFYKVDNIKRQELMYIFYACVFGIILSYIIKQFIDIQRPEAYIDSTKNLLLSHIPEKSFPSDHATVSLAFVTSLLYTSYKKIFYIFLPFVIIMNISRIIVGVHWPLDIFAGALLWMFSAVIFFQVFSQLKFVKKLDLLIIKCMKSIKLY